MLSQSAPLLPGSTAVFSFVQNVDRTQVRGVEFVVDQYDVFIPGLELMGSLTAADGRIRQDDVFAASVGKFIPGVPKLKANAVATYRPDDNWSFTMGARYSDRSFDEVESDLGRNWDRARGNSSLAWDRAKYATRDSWQRVSDAVERATPGDSDHDGK